MQVENRHNLTPENKNASDPGRTAREGLQSDAGHDLLDMVGVQGEAAGADLE
jgi:hypothetical protein